MGRFPERVGYLVIDIVSGWRPSQAQSANASDYLVSLTAVESLLGYLIIVVQGAAWRFDTTSKLQSQDKNFVRWWWTLVVEVGLANR